MILISDLINAQIRTENATDLKGVLGDGLLYSSNIIYRRIRNEAVAGKVWFSDRAEISNYLSCPHLCFRTLLAKRVVPYFKNTRPLLRIYHQAPQLPVRRLLEIRRNKILHESAHLVAQPLLAVQAGDPKNLLWAREFVLSTLLSESFASAVEVIGMFFSEDLVHRWMYRLNSNEFGCESDDYQSLFLDISSQFGLRFSFRFILLSFLCWNFFLSDIRQKDLECLLILCGRVQGLTRKDRRKLLRFFEYHFRVRNRFRAEVAEYYLKSCGIRYPLQELINFKFLAYMTESVNWGSRLKKLSALILPEVDAAANDLGPFKHYEFPI